MTGVLDEAVAASVQAARDVATEVASSTRGAVVIDVDPTNAVATVMADGPNGGPFGADVVCPQTLIPGDRVMVLFASPHGAMVIGRYRGDSDDWHLVGESGEPDFDGGKGVRWDNTPGTVYTGQTGFSVVAFTRRSSQVELRGHASRVTGTDNDVFPLPENYRPENNLFLSGSTGLGAYTPVLINAATGMVSVASTSVNDVKLDGITFIARAPNPTI